MQNIQQKVLDAAEDRFERFKERSVEKTKENFSKIPSYLLEQATGIKSSTENSKEKPAPQNYTSFSEAIREQLGITFQKQDKPELDKTREELAALQRQMDFMRNEEAQAQAYLKQKEEERQQRMAAEDEEKAARAAQEQQAAAAAAEPATKAKRGQEKRKMPDKTMENKASFGKQ